MRRLSVPFVLVLVLGAFAAIGLDEQDLRPCLPYDRTLTSADERPAGRPLHGNILVANQFSNSASLIDLETGAVDHIKTGTGPHDATISPDGRFGVVSNFTPAKGKRYLGNKLFVIDIAGRTLVRTIDTGEYQGLHDLVFRPGHPTRVLVTAQTSRSVIEVDIDEGQIVGIVSTDGDRSHVLAVTADGGTGFTTNEGSASISRLDFEARRLVAKFPASEGVEGIAVTADGRELWVGEPRLGAVTVRSAEDGRVLRSLTGFRQPVRIRRTPDGARVVISDPGCRAIVVADPARREVLTVTRAPQRAPVTVGDFSPDGSIAFVSFGGNRRLAAVDLETGRILAEHSAGWLPDGLGWGPSPLAKARLDR